MGRGAVPHFGFGRIQEELHDPCHSEEHRDEESLISGCKGERFFTSLRFVQNDNTEQLQYEVYEDPRTELPLMIQWVPTERRPHPREIITFKIGKE
jgi:hypothetical protein